MVKSRTTLDKSIKKRRPGGGNKPKDQLDRFIPKLWYWIVKSRCDWSDSDLNIAFIPDKDGNPRDRTNRTRTFEGIRKRGVAPSSAKKKHHSRDFDLVECVDAHPFFRGTARVMSSPFWRLLKGAPGDTSASSRLVDECLAHFALERVSAWDALVLLVECDKTDPIEKRHGLKEGDVSAFEVLMQRATSTLLIDLDLLCLFGAMYREACLSFLPAEAELLGHYFEITLQQFCDQKFPPEIRDWLTDIARNRVLYGKRDYFPPTGGVDVVSEIWAGKSLVIRPCERGPTVETP